MLVPGITAAIGILRYRVHQAKPKLCADNRVRGRRDAERNCLSNIRPGGLTAPEAAAKLAWLMHAAMVRGGSGVALKDEAPTLGLPA